MKGCERPHGPAKPSTWLRGVKRWRRARAGRKPRGRGEPTLDRKRSAARQVSRSRQSSSGELPGWYARQRSRRPGFEPLRAVHTAIPASAAMFLRSRCSSLRSRSIHVRFRMVSLVGYRPFLGRCLLSRCRRSKRCRHSSGRRGPLETGGRAASARRGRRREARSRSPPGS